MPPSASVRKDLIVAHPFLPKLCTGASLHGVCSSSASKSQQLSATCHKVFPLRELTSFMEGPQQCKKNNAKLNSNLCAQFLEQKWNMTLDCEQESGINMISQVEVVKLENQQEHGVPIWESTRFALLISDRPYSSKEVRSYITHLHFHALSNIRSRYPQEQTVFEHFFSTNSGCYLTECQSKNTTCKSLATGKGTSVSFKY